MPIFTRFPTLPVRVFRLERERPSVTHKPPVKLQSDHFGYG